MNQQELIDTEMEFYIVDSSNIDEYLYDRQNGLNFNESAEKQFDYIDIVFIEGDANLRPWSPHARKFLILIKNCLKSNKILWASSFAAQALIYLISTNIEKPLKVINGNNGSNYEDLKDMAIPEYQEYDHLELFLDNITGDFYHYNHEQKQWLPYANVGMHYRKAAQEHPVPGKIISNPTVDRANALPKEIYQIYEGQNTECICYLKKQYVSHYCLIDVDSQFLVPAKNSWDVHSIKFPNPKLSFQILADSKFNCQIIEINDYTVSTSFNVSNKYPQTVKVLKNFILHQLRNIKNGTKSVPIKQASIKMLDGRESGEGIYALLKPVSSNSLNPSINCFRKDELYISAQIGTKPRLKIQGIKSSQLSEQPQESPQLYRPDALKMQSSPNPQPQLGHSPAELFTNSNARQTQRPMTALTRPAISKSRPLTAMTSISQLRSQSSAANIGQSKSQGTQFSGRQQEQMPSPKSNALIQKNIDQYEECIEDQKIQKNKSEIRLLLHPKLSQEGQNSDELLWIPGILSCRQLGLSSKWYNQRFEQTVKPIRIQSAKIPYNYFINQHNNQQVKQVPKLQSPSIEQLQLSLDTDTPTVAQNPITRVRPLTATHKNITRIMQEKYRQYDLIRNQSIMTRGSPYVDQQKIQLNMETEQNKLNIGPKHFATSVNKDLTQLKVSGIEYTKPASAHQFRDIQPEKWVSRQNFMLHFPKKNL